MAANMKALTAEVSALVLRPPATPSPEVRDYLIRSKMPNTARDLEDWTNKAELPTAEEVNVAHTFSDEFINYDNIPKNKKVGAWHSKEEYLESHYGLLREDAIASLRAAIQEVKLAPRLMEKQQGNGYLYDHVYIDGLTFAKGGIAVKVQFSTTRSMRKIRWEQSKRLTSGSVVALTPTSDMFKTRCVIAVVASRPLDGLKQNPPSIHLYFRNATELEIDPAQEWFMVESKAAYFEAYRYTLSGLQHMVRANEHFPLAEQLIHIKRKVETPGYLLDSPVLNLAPILTNTEESLRVNVLHDWPTKMDTTLDESQIEALRQMVTKKVAVVQGPPGTGKTYVAVQALKLLLQNSSSEDGPIIVAAQTNHALDQLLRHIAPYEPEFIRLGGRSTDQEVIVPRTMYEVRSRDPKPRLGRQGHGWKIKEKLSQSIMALLQPLVDTSDPLSAQTLLDLGAISQLQFDNLEQGALAWLGGDDDESSTSKWLSKSCQCARKRRYVPDEHLEYEDEDGRELFEENETDLGSTDEDLETLRGEIMLFAEPMVGKHQTLTRQKLNELLITDDLWDLKAIYRGTVYNKFREKAFIELKRRLQDLTMEYEAAAQEIKIGTWQTNYIYLKETRIVGMTTTGLNKYRGLLACLKPKILLIEEASETLEANITTACVPSLEHLILVGDHKQLRPHCACQELEEGDYNLAVSLFERLIENQIEFIQLKTQRRMRPEIRENLTPVYPDLDDHESVRQRGNIPGMGGINSYFISHTFPENNDDALSKTNLGEADLITGFFRYLTQNGVPPLAITVLTFYNGQRKAILSRLRNVQKDIRFKVATVDSYQGEENEIVLLSLVRNNATNGNEPGSIGFVNVENRICVALSRAKRGFYIFGNDFHLVNWSALWEKVIGILHQGGRLGPTLMPTCQNHKTKILISDPSDWARVPDGGCHRSCTQILPCRHTCPLKCHPFDHSGVACNQACTKSLQCGHSCKTLCGAPCICDCGPAEVPDKPQLQSLMDSRLDQLLSEESQNSGFPESVKMNTTPVAKIQHKRMFVGKTVGPPTSRSVTPASVQSLESVSPGRLNLDVVSRSSTDSDSSPRRNHILQRNVNAYQRFANGGHEAHDVQLGIHQQNTLKEMHVRQIAPPSIALREPVTTVVARSNNTSKEIDLIDLSDDRPSLLSTSRQHYGNHEESPGNGMRMRRVDRWEAPGQGSKRTELSSSSLLD
ncbi:hypothetical protein MMC25_003577 [Agyrium rufum]|nr:hypothetical protein [Agyrium rufum]